jgi:amino acid transporter
MALVSALGCVLACLNAGSRILFSMGRHGVFHQAMGGAHETNETPHLAVTVCTIIMIIASATMMKFKNLNDILSLGCQFATYGFLLAYIMISLAAPFYMKKRGILDGKAIAKSLLAMTFMIVPVVGSFYPVPTDFSLWILPYLFFGYMAIGAAWLIIRRSRSRKMIDNIEKDLEEIGQRFNVGKSMYAADKEPR